MKTTLMMLALLFFCCTFSATARAQGSRSYISPNGSDNRQCTRTQPCRTFDGAMAKTDEGGEIVALENGVYDPATVTKSMTLTAAPGADVVIRATNGNAVTVSTPIGATVVLRGLKMAGPGKDSTSNGVLIDPQVVTLALSIENSVISDFSTGIRAFQVQSAQVMVSDSIVRNNTTGALMSIFGTDAMGSIFTRTRFERNSVGLSAANGTLVAVKDSVASGNGSGFLADSGGKMTIFDSIASKNGTGIEAKSGGTITIGHSTVTGNSVGMAAIGQIRSLGNNMVAGNDIDVANSPNVTTITPR